MSSSTTGVLSQDLRTLGVAETFVARAAALGTHEAAAVDWIDLAADLRQAGQRHAGLLVYEAAERHFPADRYLWNNRGVLLRSWGRYPEALHCFETALAIDPTYLRAMEGRAECFKLMGDYGAAAAGYQTLLEHTGGTAEAWNNYAQCLHQLGDEEGEVSAYRRSVSLDPRYTQALFNFAASRNRERAFGEALEAVDTLLEIDPDDAEAARLREEILRRPEVPTPSRQPATERTRQVVRDGRRGTDVQQLNALVEEGLRRSPAPEPMPPAVFVSYRWGTPEEDAWVARLAADLERRGYDVVLDRKVQAERSEPLPVPELVALILRCSWFVPILTEPYRRRVELRTDAASVIEDGWVFDEFQAALRLGELKRLTWKGVWRSGPVVPLPFRPENTCDFRDDAGYEAELDRAFPRCVAYITGVRPDGTLRFVGPVERVMVQTVGRTLESTGEFMHFIIAYAWEGEGIPVPPSVPAARSDGS